MPRTVPVSATRANGNEITASAWNAGPVGSNTFLTGRPEFLGLLYFSSSFASGATSPFDDFLASSVLVDSDNGVTLSTGRYVAQVAGWYLVCGAACWTPNVSGQRMAMLRKNGVDLFTGSSRINAVPTSSVGGAVAAPGMLVQMNVGDYLELWGFQNSGSTMTVNNSSFGFPVLSALWVSA